MQVSGAITPTNLWKCFDGVIGSLFPIGSVGSATLSGGVYTMSSPSPPYSTSSTYPDNYLVSATVNATSVGLAFWRHRNQFHGYARI